MASRATRHAVDPSSTIGDGQLCTSEWLICRAGSHAFGLPISDVVETFRALPIVRLAGTPPLVRGLCIVRGGTVVILDTGVLFGYQALNYERIVTVRIGRRTIGLLAGSIVGLRKIPAGALAQLPALLDEIETIASVTRLDDELVFFLQAARAISDEVLALIDQHEMQT